MIKKLLSVCILVTALGTTRTMAQASCTPNLSCIPAGTTQGICPDSTTGIPSAVYNTAYNTTMSIMIPATTVYMGSTINLTHFGVTAVLVDTSAGSTGTYVPLTALGLNYLGSGSNTPPGATPPSGVTMTQFCYWTAPNSACVVVSGTPNKVGTFPIRIQSYVRTVIFTAGVWQPAPDNNDYKLVVTATAGIEALSSSKFEVLQNNPNPFSTLTHIDFSVQTPSDVDFKVFNMLGAIVCTRNIKAEKGINSFDFDASSLAPGIYVYSMKNGDKTITKRMIVSGK